ncbi:hypothetical protein AC579_2143 [Pseudocercospora musae]|uniref:Amino acid permease/ SLC12A domain-containing protein n=1 Tax=Pseudocercospora musae TaxID=113226 RepID=A0A139IEA6_9PEZI|nr:hypothetical protein AC579_2143 [Pseudocercospora musae]
MIVFARQDNDRKYTMATGASPFEKGAGQISFKDHATVLTSVEVGHSHVTPEDHTQRKIKPRHIQLIGIAGTIGTGLFVAIGRALISGGPASLFIAYTIWCPVVYTIALCMSEMATFLPISSPFIRFAGRFVDEAFGVAAGYNFFLFQASLLPFEITVCNLVIHYWTEAIPTWAICLIFLALYAVLNYIKVSGYGEAEFWHGVEAF